jgi:hypothetical protein
VLPHFNNNKTRSLFTFLIITQNSTHFRLDLRVLFWLSQYVLQGLSRCTIECIAAG